MTVFSLKEDFVQVEGEMETIFGVQVQGSGVRHITYTQFYDILRATETNDEQSPVFIYNELMSFFGATKLKFPSTLIKVRKTSEGLVCTQIFGGAEKVFTESNFDTSRIRVDFLISPELMLIKDSIVAYRYNGIYRVGFLQEGRSQQLPALTEVIKNIVRTNKKVANLGQADIQRLIRKVPQRSRFYNRLEPYFNTDTAIQWEGFL